MKSFYRIIINGIVKSNSNKTNGKKGFYTAREVEAISQDEAENEIIELIRSSPSTLEFCNLSELDLRINESFEVQEITLGEEPYIYYDDTI